MILDSKKKFAFAALGLWMVLVVTAWVVMCRYENRPGQFADLTPQWPHGTHLLRAADRESLLVFLHPECACSQATLAEIEKLLGQFPNRFSGTAVFLDPDSSEADWHDAELAKRAEAIGLQVVWDRAGDEAKHFGVTTSGATFLFESDGRRVFSGGVTASRGHEGDNAGIDALRNWFSQGRRPASDTFVFGCALFNRGEHHASE